MVKKKNKENVNLLTEQASQKVDTRMKSEKEEIFCYKSLADVFEA